MSLKKGTIKGISYGRVSTFEQAYNDDGSVKGDASPQMQKERCFQYIANLNLREDSKAKYEIIEHLSDDGFSGKNTKRPGYQKLLKYIESKEISFVVSAELSRISRNTYEFLELLALCEKNHVDVIVIGLNLDTLSPFGKTMTTILVTLAQFEREMTVQRVKANSKARLIRDGKINGTNEVLGLDADPNRKGHFVVNKDQVKILEEIYTIFLNSSHRAECFRKINELGITNKKGKPFTKNTFASLFTLAKYRYRGLWPMFDENEEVAEPKLISLPHGPILDLDLLDKVEEKLLATSTRVRKIGKNYTYLLTGLLQYEDGTKFYGHPAKNNQYRYYHNSINDLRIRCDEIDPLIINRLNDYLSNDSHFLEIITKAMLKRDEYIPEVKEKIVSLENELVKINEEEVVIKQRLLVTNDNNSTVAKWLEDQISSIVDRKSKAQVELDQLKMSLDELKRPVSIDSLKDSLKMFQGQFKKQPNEVKRNYLDKFFEKIVIKQDQTIELHLYTLESLREKKSKSLQSGLDGGTNRT